MRRLVPFGLALFILAGCEPPIPDSRPGGVGFENYSDYQRRRAAEAEAARAAAAARSVQTVPGPVQNPALPYPVPAGSYAGGPVPATAPATTGAPTAAELAEAGIGGTAPGVAALPTALPGTTQPAAALPTGIPPANPAVTEGAFYPKLKSETAAVDNGGISDEQDFQAVAARETIESDKARIEQNRAAYQQVQPTDLPARTGASEAAVDLVQYALSAPNRLGEAAYPRSRIALANSEKACARYATPEAAQQAFLAAGGPKRDRKNLDPDGDGFACFWDPTPFQQAKN